MCFLFNSPFEAQLTTYPPPPHVWAVDYFMSVLVTTKELSTGPYECDIGYARGLGGF